MAGMYIVQTFWNIRGQVRPGQYERYERKWAKNVSIIQHVWKKCSGASLWRHCKLIWPRMFFKSCTYIRNVSIWSYIRLLFISKRSGVIEKNVKGDCIPTHRLESSHLLLSLSRICFPCLLSSTQYFDIKQFMISFRYSVILYNCCLGYTVWCTKSMNVSCCFKLLPYFVSILIFFFNAVKLHSSEWAR